MSTESAARKAAEYEPINPAGGDWFDWPEESFDIDTNCKCRHLENHSFCPVHGLGRDNIDKYRQKHPEWFKRIHEHAREIGKHLAVVSTPRCPTDDEIARVIYERAFDCRWVDTHGIERDLWLEVAKEVAAQFFQPAPSPQGKSK